MGNVIRVIYCCLLAAAIATPSAYAQAKPDFSGSWVLENPTQAGTDIPLALIVRQPLQRTTALGDPMVPAFLTVTVERHFQSDVRTDTYHIGTEGGTVAGTPGGDRSSTGISVRWDAERLRIDTRVYPTAASDTYTEHDEVWRLDGTDRVLITLIDRRSDSEGTSRTIAYKRQ
jgi:hypothetical protein